MELSKAISRVIRLVKPDDVLDDLLEEGLPLSAPFHDIKLDRSLWAKRKGNKKETNSDTGTRT